MMNRSDAPHVEPADCEPIFQRELPDDCQPRRHRTRCSLPLTLFVWHPDHGVGYVCHLCGFWLPVRIPAETSR